MPKLIRLIAVVMILMLAGLAPATRLQATPPDFGARDALVHYFAKINQRQFHAAFLVWERDEQGRNAAGQSEAQFRAGFAQTRRVVALIGPEGYGDGAAGSIYMPLDVRLTATLRSGRKQVFKGTYTMRKSNVEGGHHDWQIASAKMVRVK